MKEGATATRGCRRGLGATCEWLRGFKVAWFEIRYHRHSRMWVASWIWGGVV